MKVIRLPTDEVDIIEEGKVHPRYNLHYGVHRERVQEIVGKNVFDILANPTEETRRKWINCKTLEVEE